MHWNIDLIPRDALAAPTSDSQTHILSIVILVVSVASALGAGWIMLSFACFKNLRSFRHQLILGLAVSDFVMAVNFLSSSAMNLGGRFIGAPEQKAFCSFNGYMTQVFVVQTDYWVLVIAISTYFILADHKTAASWVQDRRILLASLPWLFSIIWASIGLGVVGYGNIGAWCWFTSDEVRLLVNFIPRWLIIVGMLVVYARLYFVLFRAHRFLSTGADEESSAGRTLPSSSHRPPASSSLGTPNLRQAPPHSRKLKRLARMMLMYPVAYMLIWTLPTSIRIYQATRGTAAPFALQTVDKACIVVQGLVDALIYGANESSLASWRNLLRLPHRPRRRGDDDYPALSGVGHSVSSSPTGMLEAEKHTRGTAAPEVLDVLAILGDGDGDGDGDDGSSSASSFHVGGQLRREESLGGGGRGGGGEGADEVELYTFSKRRSGSGITTTVQVNVVSREAAPAGRSRSASAGRMGRHATAERCAGEGTFFEA